MIKRRELLRGAALCATALSAQAVSACSWVEYEPDEWGKRLIEFMNSGRADHLSGLFHNFSSLVSFDTHFVQSDSQLQFSGSEGVKEAMLSFRSYLTQTANNGPRRLMDAKIVGSEQQGRMNRIELLFAEDDEIETSCGPTRNEERVDLYYQAGVYETGEDWVRWAVERIAIMPPLDTEKFDG